MGILLICITSTIYLLKHRFKSRREGIQASNHPQWHPQNTPRQQSTSWADCPNEVHISPRLRCPSPSHSYIDNIQGTYDYPTIHTLINTCPVLHVSFVDPEHPFPVVLPMLGCTGSFSSPDDDPLTTSQDIYIHGYVSGRIFKTSKSSSESQGLPITIAATFLDGLVLSLTPFHNSCNYRSAVVYGYAELVEDEEEKMYGMERITENIAPGRWEKSRVPPTKTEMNSTSILRVRVESGMLLPSLHFCDFHSIHSIPFQHTR